MTTVAQALASNAPRLGIFFRLGFATPLRLWLGVGDINAKLDVTDGTGATYSGLGQIIDLPALQQLINGAADRVTFHLSGVSPDVLTVASTEADAVKGISLNLGIGVFGTNWQLLADPTWIKRLFVDYLTVDRQDSKDGSVRTVALACRTVMTGRRRPGLSYFTDDEQQSRSPGDLFCNQVARYSVDVTKVWPRF
jgi:hypothetical protein